MNRESSRRNFLAAGLALPAVASAARTSGQSSPAAPPPSRTAPTGGAPAFQYRTLGKTGLKVTSLGFGCMITSDGSVIERAADMGITYFDTARSYSGGNNERMVGAALKGRRNRITLSTKTEGRTKPEALEQIDKSLSELGTDHVDIWYLHAKGKPEDVTDDLLEAQQIARKAGKIRFAGVSTHGGQQVLIPWLARNPNVDVILTTYNFTMEPFMNDVLAEAAQAGKGIVCMKVMAGGTRGRGATPAIGEKLHREGALTSALKWVLRNPHVGTTVPSMTDMDQLDANLKAMSQPFGAADERILAMHLEHITPFYCRLCGECAGQCRQGLPVEDVLRFATYAEGYGQFALGRERFLGLAPVHVSARCGDCAECSVNCPYGVQVAREMARAQEMFA
jgi:aryl-alcohol dehydrogenase-like predicted oxidoreductase